MQNRSVPFSTTAGGTRAIGSFWNLFCDWAISRARQGRLLKGGAEGGAAKEGRGPAGRPFALLLARPLSIACCIPFLAVR